MKKVKFIKDYVYENGKKSIAGEELVVTDEFYKFLLDGEFVEKELKTKKLKTDGKV